MFFELFQIELQLLTFRLSALSQLPEGRFTLSQSSNFINNIEDSAGNA